MSKRTIIAMATLTLLAAGMAAGKEARARFKEEAWDFGKVKQGEILAHEFVFTNDRRGDARHRAGRDVLRLYGRPLPRKTGSRRARKAASRPPSTRAAMPGRVVKYIYVESNDASGARRELKVSAEIDVPPQPRIELDRYNADLGLSLEGEATSTRFSVKNVGELELKIEIDHPDFKFFVGGKPAVFPMSVPAGKEAAFEVRFPPPAKPGMLRDYVLVKSNDPVRASLSIYISRYVITKQDLKALFNKYKKELDKQDRDRRLEADQSLLKKSEPGAKPQAEA